MFSGAVDALDVVIGGERLVDADDVRRIQRLDIADPDHRSVGREHVRVDRAHFFQRRVILRRDIAEVVKIVRVNDLNDLLHDAVVVPRPLDLDIQKEHVIAALRELDHLIQRRYFGPCELFAEKASVVQVFDLVVSDFPDVFVISRRPSETVVVKHDDRSVRQHLHIQFRRLEILVDALLERGQRVLRAQRRVPTVRHDHRLPVVRVEHPADLCVTARHREVYADQTERDDPPLEHRISGKIVRRIRVIQDLFAQLFFPLVIGRLIARHHERRHDPVKENIDHDADRRPKLKEEGQERGCLRGRHPHGEQVHHDDDQ